MISRGNVNILIIISGIFWFISCATNIANRRELASTKNFLNDLQKAQNEFSSANGFSTAECELFLEKINRDLFDRSGDDYLPYNDKERRMLLQDTPLIMQQLFNFQLQAQEHFKKLEVDKVPLSCVSGMHQLIRSVRHLSEYFAEWYAQNTKYEDVAFDLKTKTPQLLLNSNFPNLQLQAGDVILASSTNVANSFFTRLGDEGGQFSHIGIVWINPQNIRYVVSSDVTTGLNLKTWDEFLQTDFQRILIYRHGSKELAAKAASKIAQLASQSQSKGGHLVSFDFQFDDQNSDQFYSAEVVAYAYGAASEGTMMIPSYRTSLAPISFHAQLNELKIQGDSLFNPSDLEIDPQFTLIAEWKIFSELGDARIHDVIMVKLLEWMIEKEYYLTNSIDLLLRGQVKKIQMKIFNWHHDVEAKEPSSTFAVNLWQLERVYGILENYLQEMNREHLRKNGRSLNFQELGVVLEKLRKEDCELYLENANNLIQEMEERDSNHKLPLFHYKISPQKAQCY